MQEVPEGRLRKGECHIIISTPCSLKETYTGIREVSLYTEHLTRGRVFLSGPIDMELADSVAAQLLYLEQEGKEVQLIINSPGGEVTAGLMLYDVLGGLKVPVSRWCCGIAASMAAILLCGGEKGRRFILPHSRTMIHEPLLQSGVGGSATSIQALSESILETRSITNGILAKHTGKAIQEIDAATAFDNYMNAEQSVAFGLCDEIRSSLC